jgi:hypothetical protein
MKGLLRRGAAGLSMRLALSLVLVAAVAATFSAASDGSTATLQATDSHEGSKVRVVTEVVTWHVFRIVGPRQIDLETGAVATCTGLIPPQISKIKKAEGPHAVQITVWVRRRITGACLDEAVLLRRRVKLSASLARRPIYDGGASPPEKVWPYR